MASAPGATHPTGTHGPPGPKDNRPATDSGQLACDAPFSNHSRRPGERPPATHRDDDGSAQMLNYPHRLCPSAAQLHLKSQLALLIYPRSLHDLPELSAFSWGIASGR